MSVRVNDALKRGLDLLFVVPALPIAALVIGLAGVLIRVETPGPVLFRQRRIGRSGRLFTVYKLRTMVEGAETMGAGYYYEENDSRLTSVGKLLRRSSLDELPQLFNVLIGDMSLVGPRPMLPMTVEEYAEDYGVILRVKPGLTGLSQVSGRNDLPRTQRIALDKHYALHPSPWLDLRILWKTLGVLISGAGQRNDQSREDVEQ